MEITPTKKKCPKCCEVKPLGEFYNNKNKPDGKAWSCKTCDNKRTLAQGRTPKGKDLAKKRSERFREKNPEKVKASQKKFKEKKRALIKEAKESGCIVCGYTRCLEAIDLHHVDPDEKDKSVADLLCGGALESVREEIAKCIPLCANCHREHHAGQLNLEISVDDED